MRTVPPPVKRQAGGRAAGVHPARTRELGLARALHGPILERRMHTSDRKSPFSLRLIVTVGVLVVALSIPLWLIGPPDMRLRLSGRSPDSPPLISSRLVDSHLELRFDIHERVGKDHQLGGRVILDPIDGPALELPITSLQPVISPGPVQHIIVRIRLPAPLTEPDWSWDGARMSVELRFQGMVMLRFHGTMPAADGILYDIVADP